MFLTCEEVLIIIRPGEDLRQVDGRGLPRLACSLYGGEGKFRAAANDACVVQIYDIGLLVYRKGCAGCLY